MATKNAAPIVKKATSKPVQKSTVVRSGQPAVKTPVKSPVKNPVAVVKPPSVMPGQPGVPTGAPVSVMPGQPGVPTGATLKEANPIGYTPAPAVNQAAQIASNIVKAAQANIERQTAAETARPMTHPAETISGPGGGGSGSGYSSGGFSSGGVGSSGSGIGAVPPIPQITTPAPVVSAPAPSITSPTTGEAPSNVGTFTSLGNNMTAGMFNRQRLNRGPRTGMSVTPEMLRRIAAQRIGPT